MTFTFSLVAFEVILEKIPEPLAQRFTERHRPFLAGIQRQRPLRRRVAVRTVERLPHVMEAHQHAGARRGALGTGGRRSPGGEPFGSGMTGGCTVVGHVLSGATPSSSPGKTSST